MYEFKPYEDELWQRHGIAEELKIVDSMKKYLALSAVRDDLSGFRNFKDIRKLVQEVLWEAYDRIDVYSSTVSIRN